MESLAPLRAAHDPSASAPRERHDLVRVSDFAENVRIKRGGPFIHPKSYSIDGVCAEGSAPVERTPRTTTLSSSTRRAPPRSSRLTLSAVRRRTADVIALQREAIKSGGPDESKKQSSGPGLTSRRLMRREPQRNGDGLRTSGFSFAQRSIFALSMTTPFGP